MDILKRGISNDGTIKIFVAITTELVGEAQKIHNTYPVATAALGRTLTGASLMGADLKNDSDSVTLQIKGDGELGNIVAVTDNLSNVRGYVSNPKVHRPLNKKGKLDVGGAVGKGVINVIRDFGMKEPYIGQVPLVSGEIAEDITMYFAKSEQIPTACALGVLVDVDNSVLAAGGFMVQMLPGSTDEDAIKLTKIMENIEPITKMISDGMSVDDIFFKITDGIDCMLYNDEVHPKYLCKCSRERMENALISIGSKEIKDIIEEQGEAELNCQFCNNKYTFSKEELFDLIKECKN